MRAWVADGGFQLAKEVLIVAQPLARHALASCISLLVLASVFLAMALPRYRNHLMNKTPTPASLADAATA